MAEALVSSLVETVMGDLCSAVVKEIGLAWGLDNDLNNLESIFDTIQLVLQDAEMKQRKSLPLQNWLRKLKDAAYDAEDILDQIATVGLRRRVDSQRGNSCNKLKSFISPRNPLIFRFKIARKVRSVRERLDAISEERLKFHLSEGIYKDNKNGDALENRQTSSLVNESEIYGRDEEKEMVIEKLLYYMSNRDDLSVYAICGMGGIGKTTLAQLVYNDESVDRHFELRIWVCVSVDFSIHKLAKAIIESLEGGGCNISELDQLLRRLQEKLRGRRFLLVLDDVWNENERLWDELKEALRCGSKGSALLVTTRIEKIAIMMASVDIHNLQCLSEDESWFLFKKRAFATGGGDHNLEEIGKEIVKKCGGVPLAVKALGSLMRYKISEREWLAIKESEMWHLSDDGNGVLTALMLSYDNLSLQMRNCFAYCCIFPKDTWMEEDKLIQLWLANGFIHSEGEIAGHLIFKELVWRSFYQEVRKDRHGNMVCKMHDLMHDLTESVMKFETCRLEPDYELKFPKTLRHLSIFGSVESWANKGKLKLPVDGSLRSIMVHEDGVPEGFSSFISMQQYLRVLDMSFRSIKEPPIYFHKMEHLRYLSIACNNLKSLPETLTCLLNLQTLKLMNTYFLVKLPKGLKHMKKLYFLHIQSWASLVCTPPGLGELTCLKELSVFIVGQDPAHGIGQLSDLNLGGKLSIQGLGCIRDFEDAKSANLMRKKNLTCLSLSWLKGTQHDSGEHDEEVLEGLQPNQNLEEIYIESYQGSKFPTWMPTSSFTNLSKISIVGCHRCEHLPALGNLTSLANLIICGMESIKRLNGEWHGNGVSSFPALKELSIQVMRNLEEWTIPNTIEGFPCLKVLTIELCPKLRELPFLQTVKSLVLKGKDPTFLRSVMFLTSLTSLSLGLFRELDVLLAGGLLLNDKAELVQPLIHLKKMDISDCEGLCSLPNWLWSLQSLCELYILFCGSLNSLPDCFQNLKSLRIFKMTHCPLLEKRCKKPNGEDWPKISHIPEIYYNNKSLHEV